MSEFVLDCSVAIAWLFDDEASDETDSVLEFLRTNNAIVPSIWRLEVVNVLVQAEKRNRLKQA